MSNSLLALVRQLASLMNDTTRRYLRIALRDLSYQLEGPNDTINRFGYYVSISLSFNELTHALTMFDISTSKLPLYVLASISISSNF
jgi:hypothetical protein